jgi:hypothetical protein
MGILGWLDRVAGRLNRKVAPTAVTVAAEGAPVTAAPAAVTEIQEAEAEEVEGEKP